MVEVFFEGLVKLFEALFESSVLPNSVKWLTMGGVFIFVELSHRAWLIIWFAIGAFSAAAFALFFPEDLIQQFGLFFIVSGGSLAGFIYYRQNEIRTEEATSILPKDRKIRCIKEINGSRSGLVVLDGVTYKARLERAGMTIKPDQLVIVTDFDADELTAIVRPIEEPTLSADN